ncbi:MAG: Rieske 2Fe-2S domain-containing protein [Chloroflexi bacterium]|nr:Rieske 2Fe-2S domain-containing protein [Chloroflexota bacterium]
MATRIGKVTDIGAGGMRAFNVGGRKVAVANVAGRFYGFDDTCTHMGCSLAAGDLDGTTVTCACHGSEYDVTTGAVLEGPAEDPVNTWAVQVDGDDLTVGP